MTRKSHHNLRFALAGGALILVLGGASMADAKRRPPPAPAAGLYDVRGWHGVYRQDNGWVADAVINGEVGYPLSVSGPTARCEPSGQWNTASIDTVSGSFPPGLAFLESQGVIAGGIKGVPTERGHWLVTLAFGQITCNGSTYSGFEQQVQFHITGSGRVVQ